MSKKDLTQTMAFAKEALRKDDIASTLKDVETALKERGYNAINQIAGYLVTSDPAYISSHRGARSLIQVYERFEIIEELVAFYLENK